MLTVPQVNLLSSVATALIVASFPWMSKTWTPCLVHDRTRVQRFQLLPTFLSLAECNIFISISCHVTVIEKIDNINCKYLREGSYEDQRITLDWLPWTHAILFWRHWQRRPNAPGRYMALTDLTFWVAFDRVQHSAHRQPSSSLC